MDSIGSPGSSRLRAAALAALWMVSSVAIFAPGATQAQTNSPLRSVSTTSALPTSTSSSQTAYVVPTAPGWTVTPLLTVGDSPSGSFYQMVGKPDGLGALKGRISGTGVVSDTGSYLTILMDHELLDWRGAVRAHGTTGSFVSQWTVDLNSLQVVAGRDLVTRTYAYSGGTWKDATGSLAFDRLCSADLPASTALYNPQTGNGFRGRMFLSGEEADEGRAFAHIATGGSYGKSYELPHIGKYAHENVLANPKSGDTTLVVSLDDSTPGQVYVYVGTKRNTGNPVERAGLKGGRLYGIKVVNAPYEDSGPISGTFVLADVSAYALQSGADLEAASISHGVTGFARPEDGAWDTKNPRSFYFSVTGAPVNGVWQTAREYKLTFDSLTQPTGGTIDLVVDSKTLIGTDGVKAYGFDNVAVDASGRVVVQEDGGDKVYISKTWRVDPTTRTAVQILESDRNRFLPGSTGYLTSAEENSGVIEVTNLVRGATWFEVGRRYYLATNQAHYFTNSTLVEGGQLYLFASPK